MADIKFPLADGTRADRLPRELRAIFSGEDWIRTTTAGRLPVWKVTLGVMAIELGWDGVRSFIATENGAFR